MRNVSEKNCKEKRNTCFILNNFCPGSRAFYEITWKNVVDADRPQIEIWRMYIECWMTRDTDTHSEYV